MVSCSFLRFGTIVSPRRARFQAARGSAFFAADSFFLAPLAAAAAGLAPSDAGAAAPLDSLADAPSPAAPSALDASALASAPGFDDE